MRLKVGQVYVSGVGKMTIMCINGNKAKIKFDGGVEIDYNKFAVERYIVDYKYKLDKKSALKEFFEL